MGELTRRVPSRWNYDAAVRRVRGKVFKWKRATADLVREVWIAHEVLTRPGARGDLVPNRTRSWAGFLEDVGLGRTTAWRWLQQYDAQEHKLLEGEARTPAKRDPVVRLLAELHRERRDGFLDRLRTAARILAGR